MVAKVASYAEIIRNLQQKKYAPIYCLMGEEDFYIDRISDYIINHVLDETEKDFNLTVAYGADIDDVATVINMAKRFPMMAEHQVVVIKEAQNIDNLEELAVYLQKPQPSTLLVICYKHGTLDRRKKLAGMIEKTGVLFESKRIKDNQLPEFIMDYLSAKGYRIDHGAAEMLGSFVGADLSRLSGELDKLMITLSDGTKTITPEHVEKNVGISREYNNYELLNAILNKDILKANTIVQHLSENQKVYPIQVTVAVLFNFFSNLMMAFYSPDKSSGGIGAFLGIGEWRARDYATAIHRFNGWKTMEIISDIRRADGASKGVDNASQSPYDILRELIFKILH